MKNLQWMFGVAICVTMASAARAQAPAPSAQLVQEAKTYYAAGADAYERGDFDAAIQAFLEAQRRVERPSVLFAIAQAFRRQYYVGKSVESLRYALEYYRRYLAADPRGPRVADASQAIAELAPAEERTAAEPRTSTASMTAAGSDRKTRLAISSAAGGAEISVDGDAFRGAPLLRELSPGKHTVRVRAKGFEDERREVVAVEGSLVAFDIVMRDKPAHFAVRGQNGARIEIDGRLMPQRAGSGYSVSPGRHLIAVSRNGYEPYVREILFSRGESKTLQVDLRTTSRRRISNGFLIAGGVALLGAGILGVVTLERDSTAKDLRDARATRNISAAELDEYARARSARNGFAVATGLAGGAALVLGGLGLALHVFDDPSRNAPTLDSDTPDDKPQQPESRRVVDVSLAPWAAPGAGGVGMGGRF